VPSQPDGIEQSTGEDRMKRTLSLATAVAALALTASAYAQNATYDYYVTGSGDSRMVMSRGGGGPGMPILRGENGARPANCAAGQFYEAGDGTLAACDDDAMFSVMAPGTGQTMDNGQPFTEGAMILQPRESGQSKGSGDTGGNVTDSADTNAPAQ
jgi:hypothetical protein